MNPKSTLTFELTLVAKAIVAGLPLESFSGSPPWTMDWRCTRPAP